jgi:hypothetical protein
LNVIPFKDSPVENVRRGLELKYLPDDLELTINVRYRVVTGRIRIEPHLNARNITQNRAATVVDDMYLFHAEVSVFGCEIKKMFFTTQIVVLSDDGRVSINEVMQEMDRLI